MPQRALKGKRVAAGLSQLALSIRARVSRWRIHLAERGALELRMDEVQRIGQVFKEQRLSKQAARVALRQL